MTDIDRQRPINPYQPPAALDADPGVDFAFADINLDLDDRTPIPFSGAADAGVLKQFLKSYDSIGAFPIVAGAVFVALLQLWAVVISGAFAMMVAGGVLIAVLMIMTSSRWYRASVFRAMHPNWCDSGEGELAPDGISIQRRTESAFYRWSWFSGVVIADSMVGFVPAEEAEMPILISTSMLPPSVTFSRLKSFARSAKVVCENEMVDDSIGWANRQVMREVRRRRTAKPSANAIPFEGPVTGLDLKTFSQHLSQRTRPLRAHVVRTLLLLGVSLSGLGFLAMMGRIGVAMVFFMFVIVAAMLAILIALNMRRRSNLMSGDNLLYYLIGNAAEEGITTDFFVAVTTVPWGNLAVQHASADRILLRQKSSRKLLIIRKNMFSSDVDWQRFFEMTRQKTADDSLDGYLPSLGSA